MLDDAHAKQVAAVTPGIDPNEVWFATGEEGHYIRPSCPTGRSIWMYTKPAQTRAGVWHGKEAYVTQEAKEQGKCADDAVPDAGKGFDLETASFLDPDQMHPKPAWDGVVPGVFRVDASLTDEELLKVRDIIVQVHACIAKTSVCPYPISTSYPWVNGTVRQVEDSRLLPTVNIAQLDQLNLQAGKPCYSLIFSGVNPWDGAIAMDICYRNEQVSKVELDDLVIE